MADDVFYIVNDSTGLVLDVRGSIQLWPLNGSPAQKWKWNQDSLVNQLDGRVLQVKDEGKGRDGRGLEVGPPKDGSDAQKWFVKGGEYLVNKMRGNCLDVKDGSTYAPGEIVHMWHERATTYIWTLKPVSEKRETGEKTQELTFKKVGVASEGRMATVAEAQANYEKVLSLLDEWTIALLDGGKVDGPGHGGKVQEGNFKDQCGEKLVAIGGSRYATEVEPIAVVTNTSQAEAEKRETGEMTQELTFKKVGVASEGRMATVAEARANYEKVLSLLDEWTIALLDGGKVDGPGHGGKVQEGNFKDQCGEKLVAIRGSRYATEGEPIAIVTNTSQAEAGEVGRDENRVPLLVDVFNADITKLDENEKAAMLETCKKLISEGADVNHEDFAGHTPLMVAALSGYREVCDLLISSGADVNKAKEKAGRQTPLIFAGEKGYADICKILVSAGAKLNKGDNSGRTALMYAGMKGNKEIVEYLISAQAGVDKVDNQENTALMHAAKNGQAEVCKILISAGADVNMKDEEYVGYKWGETSLIFAAKNGHEEVCRILIEAGADVDKKGEEGWTSLVYAAQNGDAELCKILISAGASVNASGDEDDNALMLAAQAGHSHICMMLIAAGARVNDHDKTNFTALRYAANGGHTEICKVLLSSGATKTNENYGRNTELSEAASGGHTEICKMLLSAEKMMEKNNWTAITKAANECYPQICELLTKAGANMNDVSKEGWGALMKAADEHYLDISRMLLSEGAYVNKASGDGWTPLMSAARGGHMETCQLLISAGADVSKESKDGLTALKVAMWSNPAICKVLLEAGADMNENNKDGKTALQYAVDNPRYQEAYDILVSAGAKGTIPSA